MASDDLICHRHVVVRIDDVWDMRKRDVEELFDRFQDLWIAAVFDGRGFCATNWALRAASIASHRVVFVFFARGGGRGAGEERETHV